MIVHVISLQDITDTIAFVMQNKMLFSIWIGPDYMDAQYLWYASILVEN